MKRYMVPFRWLLTLAATVMLGLAAMWLFPAPLWIAAAAGACLVAREL